MGRYDKKYEKAIWLTNVLQSNCLFEEITSRIFGNEFVLKVCFTQCFTQSTEEKCWTMLVSKHNTVAEWKNKAIFILNAEVKNNNDILLWLVLIVSSTSSILYCIYSCIKHIQ